MNKVRIVTKPFFSLLLIFNVSCNRQTCKLAGKQRQTETDVHMDVDPDLDPCRLFLNNF